MTQYYVNKRAQDNGDHEVHTSTCIFLPSEQNREALGEHSNCHDAVAKAKRSYRTANGCKTCSTACHTR